MTTKTTTPQGTKPNHRKQDRAITFLTQEEVQRLFSAIKTKHHLRRRVTLAGHDVFPKSEVRRV